MPIMSMHDVKTWTRIDWWVNGLTLKEVAEKLWKKFPTEPSFKSVEAKKKKAVKKDKED